MFAAGGVEEDIVKCMGKTYLGEFHLRGRELRAKGQNRVGNMLIPNNNYCAFEAWMQPVLDRMLEEQKAGTSWTPSKMIKRLGQEINDESSVYYWCAFFAECIAIADNTTRNTAYEQILSDVDALTYTSVSHENPLDASYSKFQIRAMNNLSIQIESAKRPTHGWTCIHNASSAAR
jgi:hypothetical protein